MIQTLDDLKEGLDSIGTCSYLCHPKLNDIWICIKRKAMLRKLPKFRSC